MQFHAFDTGTLMFAKILPIGNTTGMDNGSSVEMVEVILSIQDGLNYDIVDVRLRKQVVTEIQKLPNPKLNWAR